MVEKEFVHQLQRTLDEADYPDPFLSGFEAEASREKTLVMILDDLWWGQDWDTTFILLDFMATFDTIEHGILLDQVWRLKVGGSVSCLVCFLPLRRVPVGFE